MYDYSTCFTRKLYFSLRKIRVSRQQKHKTKKSNEFSSKSFHYFCQKISFIVFNHHYLHLFVWIEVSERNEKNVGFKTHKEPIIRKRSFFLWESLNWKWFSVFSATHEMCKKKQGMFQKIFIIDLKFRNFQELFYILKI